MTFLSTVALPFPVLVEFFTLELFLSFKFFPFIVLEEDLYFSNNSIKFQSGIDSKRIFVSISFLGLGLLLFLKYSFTSDIISSGLTIIGLVLLYGYFVNGIQSKYSI